MNHRPLTGRVALVTGANHGIGAATAFALAHLGADVGVTYLRLDPDQDLNRPPGFHEPRARDASATLKSIRSVDVNACAIEADLSDPVAPDDVLTEVESSLGPVAILVHNASAPAKDSFAPEGSHHGHTPGQVSAESVGAQLDVDARAGALLIAGMAARHRHRGATWGRIVTLTSGGPMGFPGSVSYGAGKAALENYTMSASIELAADGITANVVYPPVTDTGWVTDEVRQFVKTSTDHVHVASSGDVAEVIAWLCSDEARLVTGNVIRLR